jgi:UDP-2,3-diacylglucosamine hydrolase
MKPALAVLGTPVWDANDDDRQQALLLSDLHVPEDGGEVVTRLESVLRAARKGAQNCRVFLLGDLFDSYLGRAQLGVGVWREVAQMLRQATSDSVSVTVLHGNRDFLLGAEFERATGARVVAGGVRCVLAGQPALLLHGDELCLNDLPYQRAKRWLRHPLTRCVARRLPLRVALSVAARARRRSQQVIQSGDQTRFDPTEAAVAQALRAASGGMLVFGHIHRPARGRRTDGEYCVLPAFDRDFVLLSCGPRGIGYAQALPGGELQPWPDPAARSFP